MSFEKRDDGQPITEEWVRAQCAEFERLLAGFTEEMRREFERRAREGRHRWQDPAKADGMYTDLLAHAAAAPLCANQEAHTANFAAFLWLLRMRREGKLA